MTKNNEEYWQERMLLEEDAVRKNANQYLRMLQTEYKAGIKALDDELKQFYELYATENNISATQIRKTMNHEEWKRYEAHITELLKENGMYQSRKVRNQYLSGRISRLQALQNQAELELEKLGRKHDTSLTEHLKKTYSDSYYHMVYHFGQVGIIGRFDKLNPKKVEQICKVEWSGKSFSHRVWDNTRKLKREVKQLLSTGSICGTSVKVLSQRLAERMNVSYHRAETLVRTESARISGQATADGYEKSGVEKYRILATLDNRTSKICKNLDGKVFLLSEKVIGETYPPFHPNCRTTTVPEFDDFKIDSSRAAKDKDNKRLEVPVGMKYSEWYQKYVLEEAKKSVPKFIPIKGLSTAVSDKMLRDYIEQEFSYIPVRHHELLRSYVDEIKITDGRAGRYYADEKIVTIPREALEETGVVVHELAHALEQQLDIYHNEKFLSALNNGLENITWSDIITDADTFAEPIELLNINSDKFVTIYQRHVYDVDYEGNGRIDFANNFAFNAKTMLDYFAEGYRYYCIWPEQLRDRDPMLYQFIEELGI